MMAAADMGDPDVDLPPLKPPDKAKAGKEKRLLNFQIEQLAEQLRCLDTTVEVGVRLLPLQAARAALSEQHRQTDEQLRALAPRITEKRHEITKLRDRLKYRTEQQVDDQVRRLEQQIQTHHFRLREEEKIVREINDLKKSKRTLREYDVKKNELEQLSQRQRQLRHERDRLFGEMDRHKRAEERIQGDAEATAASAQLLHTELAELRARLESIDSEYERQAEVWRQHHQQQQREQTAGSRRRPPRPPDLRPPPPPGVVRERPPPERHREELNACAQLMAYLQRLSLTPGTTPSTTPATPSARLLSGGATPLGSAAPVSLCPLPGPALTTSTSSTASSGGNGGLSPALAIQGQPTMYVLPRKDEPVTPVRGKRRRDRRNSLRARPLTHSAEVYNQFCLLDVTPPASVRDVPAVLEQLKAKQKYYQMSALKAQQEGGEGRRGRPPGDAGPLDLTLRLAPAGDTEAPPRPTTPPQLVTMHSIGVQLPYQLTLAPAASHPPPEVVWPAPPPRSPITWPSRPPPPPPPPALPPPPPTSRPSVSVSTAAALEGGGNPASSHDSSRDSGVPSAPLSAEAATDPDVDPFAAALQSRLTDSAAQRPQEVLQVPAVTQ